MNRRGKAARQRRRAISSQQSYNRVQNADSRAYRTTRAGQFNADLGRRTVSYAGGSAAYRTVGQSSVGSTIPAGNGQALGVIG